MAWLKENKLNHLYKAKQQYISSTNKYAAHLNVYFPFVRQSIQFFIP